MPTILERLNADLKTAMKARDTERMDTLRMAISAIKYRQIDATAPLAHSEEEDVLRKQVKQRDDSIEQFAKAGRQELADKETRERAILGEYLPKELTDAELRATIDALIAGLPPTATFPDAMKAAMGALKDKAPGKAIQAAVRAAMDARVSP
jgi:uncharacterized protein YqeY